MRSLFIKVTAIAILTGIIILILLLRVQNKSSFITIVELKNKPISTSSSDSDKLSPTPTPTPTTATDTNDMKTKQVVLTQASNVIGSLKSKDYLQLAKFVHPQKGVRFSPYAFTNEQKDLVFTHKKIANLASDKTIYLWGSFDGNAFPIEMTFADYYNRFIYTHDFANAPTISYNIAVGKGNTSNNEVDAYPEGIMVEYHFPGFKEVNKGFDWESLRLIFERYNDIWYLVGIIHDEWTI